MRPTGGGGGSGDRSRPLILAFALLLASFIFLVVAAGMRAPLIVLAPGAGVLALAGVALDNQLARRRIPARRRLVVGGLLVVLGFVLMTLWWAAGKTLGLGFLGTSLVLFGLGQTWIVVERSPRLAPFRGLVVGLVGMLAIVLAVDELGRDGGGSWAFPALLLGIGLAIAGLALTSSDLLRVLADRKPNGLVMVAFLLVSVLVAGLAVPVLRSAGVPASFAVVVGLLLALFVWALTSSNSSWVFIVVIVLILTWSLLPRDASEPDPDPDGTSSLVALGDSYISGEGASRYYKFTNTRRKNECRRAPTAYSPELVTDDGLFDNVVFVACSGADGIDIHTDPSGPDRNGPSQLDLYQQRAAETAGAPRLVLVSVGGNDAGFGDIGQACAFPGDCSEIGPRWLSALAQTMIDEVRPAYEAIARAFPDVPVLVVPYPVPVTEESCEWSLLTDGEHRFLAGFVAELNAVLRAEAARIGFHFADDVPGAFERANLRICDDDPGQVGMNFFAANPVAGVVEQSVNPRNWIHNSFHPNERGHDELRKTIGAWIRGHPGVGSRAERVDQPYQVRSIEAIMGADGFAHCAVADGGTSSGARFCRYEDSGQLDVGAWKRLHLAAFLKATGWQMFVWLSAVWIFWVVLVWTWRRWRSPPPAP